MPKIIEGKLDGSGKRVALVASRFNELVTGRLVEGALDCLQRHGVGGNDISIFKVPGSFEISPFCRKLAGSGKYDGVIALGAVIRGDTPHFDYVAAEVAKGVARAGFDSKVPVIFGVLTTDTLEQALERAGAKSGNKGAEAALTALEMMDLYSSSGL